MPHLPFLRLLSLLAFAAPALAQDADSPAPEDPEPVSAAPSPPAPAPQPPEPTVWEHRIYVVEHPGNCGTRRTGWCLLGEVPESGQFAPLPTSDGGSLTFPTNAAVLDYLSEHGWAIWQMETSGLKGATRVTVRRPKP